MDLIEKLHIDLNDAKKKRLNIWIDEQKEQIVQSRTDFIRRQQKYLSNWDDFITYVRKGPWDGASNFHMPLTQIMVQGQIAKFYNILSSPEMVNLTPREGTDDIFVSQLSKLRDWYLFDYINEYDGIKTFTWEMCTDCVTIGFGIGFRNWMIKRAKAFDYIANNELAREIKDIEPQIKEIASELGDPSEIPEEKFDVSSYKEVQKIITEWEGTRLESVDFTRAYFPNMIPGVNNMDYPPMVALESDTDLSEIKLKEMNGEYFEGSYNEALKEKMKEVSKESGIQDQKEHLTGYEEQLSYQDRQRILEHVFLSYDIDEDGIDERIVLTRTPDGTILKATHLNRISRSGKRPVYKIDCFPKPRQAYSRGVPEFMYQLNEKMDLNENMKQDYMQINLAPMFAYRSSSSVDKQKIKLVPGQGIPVDDVNQDIRILSFNTSMGSLFQDQAMDWQMADRMMSTSALAQGQISGAVGAQRSTSGILALLRQMDFELIPRFQVIANQWKKLHKDLLEDLDYRVDPGLKQRVLGPSVEKAFEGANDFNDLFRISAMLDMKIDVASIINSEEMRKNDAAQIYTVLSTPGMVQQFGIVTPRGLYYALSDWLKLYNRDPEKYLDKPDFVDKVLTVWQEIQVCAQGTVPTMNMMDNHEQKAIDLQAFLEGEESAPLWQALVSEGKFVSNFAELMQQAIQRHQGLAQALAAQAPNLAQGNQSNFNEQLTSTSPQQGGYDENVTTSRGGSVGNSGAQKVPGSGVGGAAETSGEAS